VLPITLLGNPILRTKCEEVVAFGAGLGELVEQLFETLYATDHGVGLAANQVGRSERVFVFDFHDGRQGHVVNPVVSAAGNELQEGYEACLSLPGLGLTTSRLARCVVRGVDRDGVEVVYEGEGLAARCFQHELDHLNGKLYVDLHPIGVRRRIENEARAQPWSGRPALDPRSALYLGEPDPGEPDG
jgi:peptide deformylase